MHEKINLGGQAVTNGVVISSKKSTTVAVRTKDGKIVVRETPWKTILNGSKIFNLPLLRGIRSLIESFKNGKPAEKFAKNLTLENLVDGDKEPEKIRLRVWILAILIVLIVLSPIIVLPKLSTWVLGVILGRELNAGDFLYHIVPDTVVASVFISYLYLLSRVPQIKTTFSYHGAEHIVANAYEAGEDLTLENVKKYTTGHIRCGTAFVTQLIILSILTFSFVMPRVHAHIGNLTGIGSVDYTIYIFVKVLVLIFLLGVAYEIQHFISKHSKTWWARGFMVPGLLLQKITVLSPNDEQIEVGLVALQHTLRRYNQQEISEPIEKTYENYGAFRKDWDTK